MKKRSGAKVIRLACGKARYVVMRSVRDRSVVAAGDDLDAALLKADKAGVRVPFIVFPHDPSKKYIY